MFGIRYTSKDWYDVDLWLRSALTFVLALAMTLVCGGMREHKPSANIHDRPPSSQHCYTSAHVDRDRIRLFDDVLLAAVKPTNGRNIFFHETTCLDGIARLSVRQACAVESAARANPDTSVYLLYASPVGFVRSEPEPAVFRALATYANVHRRNLNVWTYTEDTPAERWIRLPPLFHSRYPAAHMADLLRLVSLYRWGGTHIDLDFVVRKSLATMPSDFAGLEMGADVENALVNFNRTGVGHMIAEEALHEFVRTFDGDAWTANGPLLLSRVLREMCETSDLLECPLFKVYPRDVFYALHFSEWEDFFDPAKADATLTRVDASPAVHMWNKLSATRPVVLGERSAYEQMARTFCPRVFETAVGQF